MDYLEKQPLSQLSLDISLDRKLRRLIRRIKRKSLSDYYAQSWLETSFLQNSLHIIEKIFIISNLTTLLLKGLFGNKKVQITRSETFTIFNCLFREFTGKSLLSFFSEKFLLDPMDATMPQSIVPDLNVERVNPIERFLAGQFRDILVDTNYSHSFGFRGQSLTETLEFLNTKSTDFLSITESEFGQKFFRLGSILLCLPMLNSIGFTPSLVGIDPEHEKALRFDFQKVKGLSLPAVILEHATWLALKFSNMAIITKREGVQAGLNSLFVSRNDLMLFEQEYMWLRRNHSNFSCCSEMVKPDGTPDPFTLEAYFNRCQTALETLEGIMPAVKRDPYARNRLERCRYDILNYQSDCAAELRAGESRPFPYAIMLTGPPSVGKSTIKDVLFHQMHASDKVTGRFGIDYSPKLVYTYNSTDDFYSGFSTMHTSLLLDDVAQKHPDIIKQQGGDDLNDLIRIINSVPFMPNQAELNKKGKTPMRVRYVIGTTNTADLSAYYVFKCPAAVYRRMVFVACEVKPEYCEPGTTTLRGDLNNSRNMDLWNFIVSKYYLHGNEATVKYWNGNDFVGDQARINIEQLMLFIHKDLDKHWTQQERGKTATNSVCGSQVCEHNISTLICSRCMTAQSFVDENIFLNIISLVLLIPIILLLLISYLYLKIFPKRLVSRPILTLRVARKLLYYIPHTPFTYKIKYAKYIPAWLHNGLCSGYYYDLYDKIRGVKESIVSWYDNDFVQLWKYPVIVGFLGALVAIKTVNHLRNKIYGESYVDDETAVMPKPTKQELSSKNVWKQQIHLGDFPNKGRTIKEYDLYTEVSLNTVVLEARTKCNKQIKTNAFMLGGNIMVTVGHFIRNFDVDEIIMYRTQKDGSMTKIEFKVDDSNFYHDTVNDLLYFSHKKVVPSRDMLPYFIENIDTVHVQCPGKMPYIDVQDINEGISCIDVIRVTNKQRGTSYTHEGNVYDAKTCLFANVAQPTTYGMCGAPIIAVQGVNKFICGIHTAGNSSKNTLIRPITQQMIIDARNKLCATEFNDADDDIAYIANCDLTITPIHPLCPTNEMEGEYIKIGSHCLPRSAPRTHVDNSPICADVVEFYKDKGFDRILHTSPKQCKPKEAIKLAMTKAFENAKFLPSEIDFCVKGMTQEFLRCFTQEELDRIKPYPMSAAINGVDGIPYLERLNLSTSGGFGHSGPKKKMFSLVNSTDEHAVCYELTPELEEEIKYIHKQYDEHKVAKPVFKCSFKDEPISFEKAKMNKVRIFSASPVAFSIFARKYLLCIIREFVGHKRLSFEMAIGANAHGMDWDEIYHHVIRHGEDRCFAGDYKNFDKQMPPELILAAFEIIKNILRAAKWGEKDLNYVTGIAYDTAFPTMDLFGTLIQCYGNNPSGHILTTPINSLVNSLYMRLACRRILLRNNYNVTLDNTGVDFTRFKDVMSLVTYGDDNCGTTSSRYPCINHTTIQQALSEAGIIYTTDDKEAESKGLVHVSTITFLKRRFVFDTDLNRMAAPLVEDSLFKALTVWTYSKTICPKEQIAAVISSVNREYFFYGKEIFEDRHEFLWSLCNKYDVIEYLPGLKLESWQEIYDSMKV